MPQKHHNTGNKRTSRAKFNCSPELAELIRRANLVKEGYRFDIEESLKDQRKRDTKFDVFHFSIGLAWSEFYSKLPKAVKSELFKLEEWILNEKEDGYEFWINNDGYAQDKIVDLNTDNEISDEEFDELINSGAEKIAKFLVEYGYYGDEYSYRNYLKQQDKDKEEVEEDYDFNFLMRISPYIRNLDNLHEVREFLLAIIKLSDHFQKNILANNLEESFYQRFKRDEFSKQVFQADETKNLKEKILATSLSINGKGEIQFEISEWANILQGVDITRIRLCEVCEDIFWANRKDAFACSPKHSKVRQMRKLRKNWKEKGDLYLKARKKKAKKKKEKKQNGSL